MTNIKNTLLALFILSLLVACNSRKPDENSAPQQETPKALQEDGVNTLLYSKRSGDLTEQIYAELVDKNPALKKLEGDLNSYNTKSYELTEKFQNFDNKSTNYYTSANHKASAIKDSLLKNKILALITASNAKNSTRNTELNSILKQISNNDLTLNDHHSVLKIVLTLPIIEKYQNENRPDSKKFKDMQKQQENFILQIDSLTPKY